MVYKQVGRTLDSTIREALELASKITGSANIREAVKTKKSSVLDIWIDEDISVYDPHTTIPVRKYNNGTIPE